MARLIDTHYHLELAPDFRAVAEEIERREIYTVAVSNAPAVYVRMKTMVPEHKYLRLAVGLHPELALSHGHQLGQTLELMEGTDYVGEIGLDGSPRFQASFREQQRIFEAVVGRAYELSGKILSIHSRRAEAAVLDIIGSAFPGVAILHWYSGNRTQARRAAEVGCYFSVNFSMLQSGPGQRLIQALPKQNVLTETDGPFIMTGDRPAQPWDVQQTVNALGELWGTDVVTARQQIWNNFRQALEDAARFRVGLDRS